MKNMNIAIVGLGYVGLPLSLQFARSDTSVLGLDVVWRARFPRWLA